jgi:hypothetical protein
MACRPGAEQALFVVTIGGLLMLALPFLGGRRRRLAASAFLVVGILDILGVTFTARFEIRHVIVLAPIAWILSTATAALIIDLIVALLRRRPQSVPRARAQSAPT